MESGCLELQLYWSTYNGKETNCTDPSHNGIYCKCIEQESRVKTELGIELSWREYKIWHKVTIVNFARYFEFFLGYMLKIYVFVFYYVYI